MRRPDGPLRAGPAGHVPRRARADQRGARAIRAGRIFPWPRSAWKAMRSGLYRYAKTEVVGSWPSPSPSPSLPACKGRLLIIPTPPNRSPLAMAERKSCRCDLLHKGLRRPGLNHQNGSENPSIIVRLTIGHRYRLCLDRNGRRSRGAGADLPDPDLTSLCAVRRPLSNIEYVRGGTRFTAWRSFVPNPLVADDRQITSSTNATSLPDFPTRIV